MALLECPAFDTAGGPVPLADNEIHVYVLRADPAQRPREVAAFARAVLGELLRVFGGVDAAPALELGAHGKPFAPSLPGLDFNLSHSGPHVAIAFARHQPLGIDLEQGARRLSIADIARRYFDPGEAAALLHLDPSQQRRAFLHLWTRKEAVLKAIGEGIGFGLGRLAFAIDASGAVGALQHIASEAGAPGDWWIGPLAPAADVVGALAWRGPPRRVLAVRLEPLPPSLRRDAVPSRPEQGHG